MGAFKEVAGFARHQGSTTYVTQTDHVRAERWHLVSFAQAHQLILRSATAAEPKRDLANVLAIFKVIDADLLGCMLDRCVSLGHFQSPQRARDRRASVLR